MSTHVLEPVLLDEHEITITLTKVGVLTNGIEFGKPKYEYTITAGELHYDSSEHEDWIAGWTDEEKMVRSLCSFMAHYAEVARHQTSEYIRAEYADVHPVLWDIATTFEETFSMNSIDFDEDVTDDSA